MACLGPLIHGISQTLVKLLYSQSWVPLEVELGGGHFHTYTIVGTGHWAEGPQFFSGHWSDVIQSLPGGLLSLKTSHKKTPK